MKATHKIKCYKAKIITVDRKNSVASYMVTNADKIIYVGNELPKDYKNHEIIDLKNKAIIPPFVDTHIHFASFALSRRGLNVADSESVAQTIEALKNYVDNTKRKTLIAFGASPHSVKEKRLPTRQELDAVTQDKEVMIVKYDGHACVANSNLIKKLENKVSNIRGFHPDSGEMNQEAFFAFSDYITNSVSLPYLYKSMMSAADYLASKGIACIHTVSGVGFPANLDITLENTFAKSLKNGFMVKVFPQSMNTKVALSRKLPRIGGCFECALDGCYGSVDAAMIEPYSNGTYGVLYYSDQKVIDFCKQANRAGLQIELHAIGDKAFNQACKALKACLDDYPRKDHRHGIIHACLPTSEGIKICKKYKIQLPMQSSFIDWKQEPDTFLKTILGKERVSRLNPINTFHKQGVPISFGSDAPCTNPDPIMWISRAINNTDNDEAISVGDAIRMCTYNGYWASFDEQNHGSLEVGKKADFVILSNNPLDVSPKKITDIKVEDLYLNGKRYTSCKESVGKSILRGLTKK